MDKAWKKTERAVAEILGGERIPVSGRQRGSAPDIAHNLFSIEVKHRKKLPDWIHDAMSQAKASIRGDQLPIVILHEKGQRHINDYVVMTLKDFRDYLGE